MLAYSLDGTRIISYSGALLSRGMICIFDAQGEAIVPDALPGHTEPIISINISPDEKWVVSGSEDKSVCVWNLVEGTLILGPLTGHTEGVHLVRYSPDGHRILSCSKDRALLQWDAQTGVPFQTNDLITDTSEPVRLEPEPLSDLDSDDRFADAGFAAAVYSPDGSYIATISCGASVCAWNSRTGKQILGSVNGETQGRMIEFSPDGAALITVWINGSLRIWDMQNGQSISNIQPQLGSFVSVSAFAFSSDWLSSVVAFWDEYEEYSTLCINTRERRGEPTPEFFKGHTAYITSVRFSPDDKRIASGSYDKTVHIWDVETGNSVSGPLEGHTDRVRDVAYSPHGTYVASASDDTTIRIWDGNISPGSSSLTEWVLDTDGWVRDSQSQRLIWIPPNLWDCLLRPGNTMRMSRDGYVRLNFRDAMVGKRWIDCWVDG
ncbi:putative serine/threonine-protein kinase PkwA [Thermomonospora curvata] [Rhizoctonia solani]|uniref:Putative serine/threonine-protein kinase PkwA [Thermomonospora curvata] n=1 Tax=Rhizoctonia solani TaxID=456999 RepID=A0A0K6GB00_9AGAM|nr:putative serine/threonine-protein kinase PkwA [Thermomonospora curvata] [Rhizoctonia solani]